MPRVAAFQFLKSLLHFRSSCEVNACAEEVWKMIPKTISSKLTNERPNHTRMKTDTVITSILIVLVVSIAQACSFGKHARAQATPHSSTLQHTLTVTPETKKAFHNDDAINIRSLTGSAPTFRTGGTYRVVGTCRQQTLNNATLYVGNTAEAGPDAIAASAGSSLYKPLLNGTTEFDITFTLLRPGLLHVTIYDLDNHDKNDNAYAGVYLGDVVPR
jgi:hypothetical protein